MSLTIRIIAAICGFVLIGKIPPAAAQVKPLPRAHAHNDYRHPRPLIDALDQGFCSVEADIYLVEGQLLVAHDREDLRPERSLKALYLDPIRERVKRNQGRVQPGGCDFHLWIDIKSEAEPTWKALRSFLEQYRDMLTVYEGDKVRRGAVTVVISGNRAASLMMSERDRLAGLDGRLPDLDLGIHPAAMPWISDTWERYFTWKGEGKIPPKELDQLKAAVSKAHRMGYRIRFWAAPDLPAGWRVLLDAGADLLNTDDLAGLARFLDQGR